MDFAVPSHFREKIKESEKINKHLGLSRELKRKTKEYMDDGDTNYN